MSRAENRAVFLSYASQDAEAAKRIAEALRAAGIEVWFDQNELVGGDAWDQKIRRQIKDCALFVPVISANTNARLEGYFRLEWKLAVDRSHLMADDAPFLFPIVIGDVSDATARVPDKFREVQWTRLRLDETPAELAGRVARLLTEDGGRDRRIPPSAREAGSGDPAPQRKSAFEKWWWLIFPIMGMAVPIIGVLKSRAPAERSQPAAGSPASPAPPAVSEARQLGERARALSLDKFNSTAADFATAEGLLRRALELDQNDAELWTISSLFNTSIRTRGFDHSPVRRERARRDAERAVALAPDSINALFALGRSLRDSDRAAAEATFRRILALDPNHAEAMSQVAWICDLTDRFDEALRYYDRVLELDPKSAPLTHYIRHLLFFHYGRFAEAEAESRKSVALNPSANGVTGEAIVALTWRGDAAAAARALAAAPAAVQGSARMIWVGALVHLARRDPDETLRTLQKTEEVYLQDNWFAGPKAMFAGLAHRQAGRPEAARVAWEAALAIVDERLKAAPQNEDLHLARGQVLAWLGRAEEARREAQTLLEINSGSPKGIWVYSPVLIHAALGDAAAAVPLLAESLVLDRNRNNGWPLTPALLRADVRWDPIRTDPRFQDMLAQAEAAQLAALPPRDWPKNPELKKAIELIEGLESIPDDFALAEQVVKPILERTPTDLEAVTVMARVQAQFMRRGFDRSDERSAQARLYGERALQLDPNEPEAMLAVATYLFSRQTGDTRAERLLRRAMDLDPGNPQHGRMLADLLNVLPGRQVEAVAQSQENVRRFPHDALTRYDMARVFKDQGRYEECDRELDATLALAPLPNAIAWKARLQFGLHNDFPGMKRWLDQVPERVRGTERTVFGYFLYAAFGGDAPAGLEALRGFTQKWFTDFEYAGPAALLNADLLELEGKRELARQQYEASLLEIQRMRTTDPARLWLNHAEFWTLLGLGRKEEARLGFRRLVEAQRRPYAQSLVTGWWFTLIPGALLLGERDTALEFLRESVATLPESRAAIRVRMQLDPRMAPFRDDPEIKAILAGSKNPD